MCVFVFTDAQYSPWCTPSVSPGLVFLAAAQFVGIFCLLEFVRVDEAATSSFAAAAVAATSSERRGRRGIKSSRILFGMLLWTQ